METQIQAETRSGRQELPQNQEDKKLKQDWSGVKFRLTTSSHFIIIATFVALIHHRVGRRVGFNVDVQ